MKTKAQKPGEQNRRHFKNYAFSKENLHLFTSKHLIKTFNKNFWIVYQSCGKIIYTWCEIVILIIINSCSLKAGFRYSRLCNYFIILLIPIFFWDALYLDYDFGVTILFVLRYNLRLLNLLRPKFGLYDLVLIYAHTLLVCLSNWPLRSSFWPSFLVSVLQSCVGLPNFPHSHI